MNNLSSRRQQHHSSCGAAAMTVGLAELHAEPNTDEADERVWRRVRGNDHPRSSRRNRANFPRSQRVNAETRQWKLAPSDMTDSKRLGGDVGLVYAMLLEAVWP